MKVPRHNKSDELKLPQSVRPTAFILLIFLLLGSTSCALLQPFTENNYYRSTPPNSAEVAENFYCDKTEIRNIDWREYMYWTSRVFGKESQEYLATVPDSTVWEDALLCNNDNSFKYKWYAGSPLYNDYPVVGISQAQAIAYSKWRSDRLLESTLIRLKRIVPIDSMTADNYFTIEGYFRGEYPGSVPGNHRPVLYYPEFRLPTIEERQRILLYSDAADKVHFENCTSRKCRDCKDDFPVFRSDMQLCNNFVFSPCEDGCAAVFFHLRGNVNEWLAAPNKAAGGGWRDNRAAILIQDTFHIQEPNIWTGFRNVCQWKRWQN